MLTWDAVSIDCGGQAESAVVYRVMEAFRTPTGFLEDGTPTGYIVSPWVERDRVTEPQSAYGPPEPGIGEAVLISIEATDEAGNRSEDCP